MKKLQKFKAFPYGTALKHYNSPLHFLYKLNPKQKSKFKQKNRLFSLELGKSLPKRVLWQAALGSSVKNGISYGNSLSQKTTASWAMFRAAFFGKMWLLNNASAVPGVVWPTKSKKLLLAKMKAFKALCYSLGNVKRRFLVKNLQELYASSFAAPTLNGLWYMAVGLDSLKYNLAYKAGFYPTISSSYQKHVSNHILENGFFSPKAKNFVYPGDFSQKTQNFSFLPFLFSFGKKESNLSFYANKPFVWLNAFYTKNGVKKQGKKLFQKKISKFYILLFFMV